MAEVQDVESLEVILDKRLSRIVRRLQLSDADVAWVLLALGTRYYFRDMCHRSVDSSAIIKIRE